jgi:hypothetical protein
VRFALAYLPGLPFHFCWSPKTISVLYGAVFTLCHELESCFLVTAKVSRIHKVILMTYGRSGVFSRSSPSKPCRFLSRVSEEYTSAIAFFKVLSVAFSDS